MFDEVLSFCPVLSTRFSFKTCGQTRKNYVIKITELYQCAGGMKCMSKNNCVEKKHVCDGKYHCESKLDEASCHICPADCICFDASVTCTNKKLTYIPNIAHTTRRLIISENQIKLSQLDLPYLGMLDLTDNRIKELPASIFTIVSNLFNLNLAYNLLTFIRTNVLSDLTNLRYINFTGNYHLSTIQSNAFMLRTQGISRLEELAMIGLSLSTIEDDAFQGLNNLLTLNLSHNQMQHISRGMMNGLDNLQSLSLLENKLALVKSGAFDHMIGLKYLESDSYFFCCVVESVRADNCIPAVDVFTSCTDLMKSDILRVCMWILGIFAIVGNVFALVVRFTSSSDNSANYSLITSLCFSDLLMGIYLITIGCADLVYQGNYIEYDDGWRHGMYCNAAGVLSMVSSEVSIVMLACLSIDRYHAIKNPFRSMDIPVKASKYMIVVAWVLFLGLSLVPLFPISYFNGEFFSHTPVCLSIPLTSDRFSGWEYSSAIFLGANTVILVITVYCYTTMFMAIMSMYGSVHGNQAKSTSRDLQVAKRMAFIIMTDLMCWIPIIVIGKILL